MKTKSTWNGPLERTRHDKATRLCLKLNQKLEREIPSWGPHAHYTPTQYWQLTRITSRGLLLQYLMSRENLLSNHSLLLAIELMEAKLQLDPQDNADPILNAASLAQVRSTVTPRQSGPTLPCSWPGQNATFLRAFIDQNENLWCISDVSKSIPMTRLWTLHSFYSAKPVKNFHLSHNYMIVCVGSELFSALAQQWVHG